MFGDILHKGFVQQGKIRVLLLSTPQEHQSILTNATVSKDSDIGVIMVIYENFFYLFQVFQRIKETYGQNNIMKKY